MKSIKFLILFLHVVGLLDNPGPGYNLSGTRGASGNPISTYRINANFYPDTVLGEYYINNGIQNRYPQNVHSRFHQQKSLPYPNNYDIFVYEEGDHNKEREQYNLLNIILNYASGNKFTSEPETINDYLYIDVPEMLIKEQTLTPSYKPIPDTSSKYLGAENFESSSSKQNFENSSRSTTTTAATATTTTTEKTVILGKPVIIPMSILNLNRGNSSEAMRASQKQCVQDCPSSSAYNPVCGTNNVTFFNEEKFLCAQNCGINILISRRGPCT